MTTLLVNKPFRVLSQFTTDGDKETLARIVKTPGVYPAGRLDYDSEGLLILTSDGRLQAALADPKHKQPKSYWVQVEGDTEAADAACQALKRGVDLKEGPARALSAKRIKAPPVWPRTPPVRFRKSVPDTWIEVVITEGRNRQVRRMTAAAGTPTLRLIRHRIGPFQLETLLPGESAALRDEIAWKRLRAAT